MFSKKADAMGPKQDFPGSSAKGKKLPSAEETNKPEKEFGNKSKK